MAWAADQPDTRALHEQDLYRLFGLSSDADQTVIAAAYRALMRKYHPDKNKSADAGVQAAKLADAFAILGQPEQRAAYDAARAQRSALRVAAITPAAAPPAPPPPRARGWRHASEAALSEASLSFIGNRGLWVGYALMLCVAVGCLLIAMQSWEHGGKARADRIAFYGIGDDEVDGDAVGRMLRFPAPLNSADAPAAVPARARPSQPPVDETDVRSAVKKAREVRASGGSDAVDRFTRRCYRNARNDGRWQAADYCVAFEMSAAHAADTAWADEYLQALPGRVRSFYRRLPSAAVLGERLTRLRTIAAAELRS